jgi:hypothetical protein
MNSSYISEWNDLCNPHYERFLQNKYHGFLTEEQIKCLVTVDKNCQLMQKQFLKFEKASKLKQIDITFNDFKKTYDECIETIEELRVNCSTSNVYDIALDTHYRNQFETGCSNGTLCNKSRKKWEYKLFKYPYDMNSFDRPKYGNLPLMFEGDSSLSDYGDCYFILKPDLKHRTTITLGDSSELLHTNVFNFNYFHFIGLYNIDNIVSFVKAKKITCCSSYVELQIHGPIRLKDDVQKFYYPSKMFLDLANSVDNLKEMGIQCYSY